MTLEKALINTYAIITSCPPLLKLWSDSCRGRCLSSVQCRRSRRHGVTGARSNLLFFIQAGGGSEHCIAWRLRMGARVRAETETKCRVQSSGQPDLARDILLLYDGNYVRAGTPPGIFIGSSFVLLFSNKLTFSIISILVYYYGNP